MERKNEVMVWYLIEQYGCGEVNRALNIIYEWLYSPEIVLNLLTTLPKYGMISITQEMGLAIINDLYITSDELYNNIDIQV